MISLMLRFSLLIGALLVVMAAPARASQAAQFHAWEKDITGDGVPEIVIREARFIPVGGVFIPRYDGEDIVLCRDVDGEFYQCLFDPDSMTPAGWPQLPRLSAFVMDMNADGSVDYFLKPRNDGENAYIVYSESDQGQYLGFKLDISQYSQIDIKTLARARVSLGAIDGGSREIIFSIDGKPDFAMYVTADSNGALTAGRIYRRSIPNGRAIRGQLKPASIPRRTVYGVDADGSGGVDASVNLTFPLGLNDQTVSMNLAYRGAGSEGLLGRGWDLFGLPMIRRCARREAVSNVTGGYRFTDSYSSSVTNGQPDVFCGEAGLLARTDTGNGLNGTYRYHGNADRWVLGGGSQIREVLSDGTSYSYIPGVAQDGVQPETASRSQTLMWVPEYRLNRFGNETRYTYEYGIGHVYPKKIAYDDVEVEFKYEPFSGPIRHAGSEVKIGYLEGVRIAQQRDRLLTRIDVRVRDEPSRSYHLGYIVGDDYSPRLAHFQECGYISLTNEEKCLIPLQFSYTEINAETELEVVEKYVSIPVQDDSGLNEAVQLDFDGDGAVDLLSARTGSVNGGTTVKVAYAGSDYSEVEDISAILGSGSKHLFTPISAAKDGRHGIFFLVRGADRTVTTSSNSSTITVYYPDIISYTQQQQDGVHNCRYTAWWYQQQYPGRGYACDKVVTQTTTATFATFDWKYYDTEIGLRPVISRAICILPSEVSSLLNNSLGVFRPRVLDASGNGGNDIILRTSSPVSGCAGSSTYLYVNNYPSASQPFSYGGSVSSAALYAQEVDLNGDSRSDLIALDAEQAQWRFARDGITGFGNMQPLTVAEGQSGTQNIPVVRTIPVDINGDGRTDMLSAQLDQNNEMAWFVYVNTGAGFESRHRMGSAGNVDIGLTRTRKEDLNVRVFDYDGNSGSDILLATKNQNYIVYQTHFGLDGKPYFKTIDTGISVNVELSNIRIADFTGDGVPDIAEFHSNSIRLIVVNRAGRGFLAGVREAWPGEARGEVETKISWTPYGDNSGVYLHREVNNSINFTIDYKAPIVKEISRPTAEDDLSITQYTYTAALVNKMTRSLIGFAEFSSRNSLQEKETILYGVAEESDYERPFVSVRKVEEYDYFTTEPVRGGSGERPVSEPVRRLVSRTDIGVLDHRFEVCSSQSVVTPYYWIDGEGTRPSCVKASVEMKPFPKEVASRTTEYDADGNEIRTVRTVVQRNGKGAVTGQTKQLGVGASGQSCASSSACFEIDSVQHFSTTSSVPTYLGGAIAGPGLWVPASTATSSSWQTGAVGPLLNLPDGLTEQSLLGVRSSTTVNQWNTDISSSAWKIVTQSVTELEGTAEERVLTYSYEGVGETLRLSGVSLSHGGATAVHAQLPNPTGWSVTDWDSYGFPTALTRGGNGVSLSEMSAPDRHAGGVKYIEDGNGLKTSYSYGVTGELSLMTAPDGSPVSISDQFCGYGCALYPRAVSKRSVTYADGKVKALYFDLMGNEIASQETGFSGESTWIYKQYDVRGRVVAESLPCAGQDCASPSYTEWDYDDHNKVTRVYRPDGGIVRTERKANGEGGYEKVVSETVTGSIVLGGSEPVGGLQRMGVVDLIGQRFITDVLGNVKSSVENSAGEAPIEMKFAHDPLGNLVWSQIAGEADSVVVRRYDSSSNLVAEYDPSAGKTTYAWNVAGDMVSSKYFGLSSADAGSQLHTYVYDDLGRMVTRTSSGATRESRWHYDVDSDGTPCGEGFLCEVSFSDGSYKETYDWYLTPGQPGAGQLEERLMAVETAPGVEKEFRFQHSYTSFGALHATTYPNNTLVQSDYQNGFLQRVGDGQNAYYEIEAYNAFGRPSSIKQGSTHRQEFVYGSHNGRLASEKLYRLDSPNNHPHHHRYSYDSRGRMVYRTQVDEQPDVTLPSKALINIRERFAHDGSDRLGSSKLLSRQAGDSFYTEIEARPYEYSVLGNVTDFAGQTGYSYNNAYAAGECDTGVSDPGPHAVRRVGTTAFCYDRFGNVISAGTRQYEWSSEHTAPVAVYDSGASTQFHYSPAGEKFYQKLTVNGVVTEKWFAGGGYEVTAVDGVETVDLDIDRLVMLRSSGGVTSTYYLATDVLGSSSMVIDPSATGSIYDQVVDHLSFDAFGRKRSGSWVGAYNGTAFSDQGFTGHQELPDFNLIHMNGRVYDPVIGRFLSPDILVQSPYQSQSYNRYSYVWNNPLNATDPSGYWTYAGDNDPIYRESSGSLVDQYGQLPQFYAMGQYDYINNIDLSGVAPAFMDNVLLSSNLTLSEWGGNYDSGHPGQYVEQFGGILSDVNGSSSYGSDGGYWSGTTKPASPYFGIAYYSDFQEMREEAYNGTLGNVTPVLNVAGGLGLAKGAWQTGKYLTGVANGTTARIFWSGGDEARLAAETFAKANGGVTLEMTAAGRRLQKITNGMDWADAKPLWEAASREFAAGAKGPVNVFQSGSRGVSLESVWRGVEYPVLKQNGNRIIYNVTTPSGLVRMP